MTFSLFLESQHPVGKFADEMVKLGWSYEYPTKDNMHSENMIDYAGRVYPTITSPDGRVKIALSATDIYMHKDRVWIGDPSYYEENLLVIPAIIVDGQYRRKGFGNLAMTAIKNVANQLGMKLVLEPAEMNLKKKKEDVRPLNRNQLVKWYKKLGFKSRHPDHDKILEYDPKQNSI